MWRRRGSSTNDVGVGADRQRALARIEAHDLGGVGRDEADEIPKAVAALFDRLGVDQRHARLDPGIAAGGVVDPPPCNLIRSGQQISSVATVWIAP